MSLESRIVQVIQAIGADVKTLFGSKQDTLVPGVTLKTINGASLLGAGDLSVSGPAGSSSVRVKAGADIGGHRVVTLDEQGRAVYASPALMRDVNRVLGLTMHAAVTDADIDVPARSRRAYHRAGRRRCLWPARRALPMAVDREDRDESSSFGVYAATKSGLCGSASCTA